MAKYPESRKRGLKPFQPGQSGNPGGRPKKTPLADAYRGLLGRVVPGDRNGRSYAEAIAGKVVAKALAGDIRAVQELADRVEGKPRRSVEIENTELREAFDRMTREELKAYAETGKVPAWFPQHLVKGNETIQ